MFSTLAVAQTVNLEWPQLEGNKDEKKRHPINKLARLNKIMNQYTVWAKGLQIESLEEKRNIYKALGRNNRWYQGLKKTFYRTDANGAPAKCSTYFNQVEERKRRSTGGLDLMPDMDTELEKCEIAAEEAEEMGGECVDCCDMDDDGNWILNNDITVDITKRNRQVTKPDDLAKAFRRVIGATKRWERRFIEGCGGAEARPFRYYNILLKRLTNGLKSGAITEYQITDLKWKRVFPTKTHKHSKFFEDLNIAMPE